MATSAKRNSSTIAWIVPEKLSDGSIAHSVVMDDGRDSSRRLVIAADGRDGAQAIVDAINAHAAWVEVQP
jgi:hypothetical protein